MLGVFQNGRDRHLLAYCLTNLFDSYLFSVVALEESAVAANYLFGRIAGQLRECWIGVNYWIVDTRRVGNYDSISGTLYGSEQNRQMIVASRQKVGVTILAVRRSFQLDFLFVRQLDHFLFMRVSGITLSTDLDADYMF